MLDGESHDQVGGDSNLKRGLLMTGAGIGLLLALGVLAGWEIGAIGLIPIFIGLARVVIWRLEDGKKEEISESSS